MFSLIDFLNRFQRSAIMGIVNATGDSFSEKGNSAPETALDRALYLLDNGADILDFGGESTRPGAIPVCPDEEIKRVIPVIKELKKLRPAAVCSIDTRNAGTASAALDCGVEIINDISMLRNAPEIAGLAARYGAALVISHSRGTPETMHSAEHCSYIHGVCQTVAEELAAAVDFAVSSGMNRKNILLDPGFGFSKTPEQCWEMAKNLTAIAAPEQMLAGVSRKKFLGWLTGETTPTARGGETLALELHLAACNIAVIRTHDVKSLYSALLVQQKLQGA